MSNFEVRQVQVENMYRRGGNHYAEIKLSGSEPFGGIALFGQNGREVVVAYFTRDEMAALRDHIDAALR